MLTPEGTRRGVQQVEAVVKAMKALQPPEAGAVRLALAQCTADIQRNHPGLAAAVAPDELVLLAAYNAATLSPPRGFLAGVLKLSPADAAAFCARIRTAAERVATEQGRRSVLDAFEAFDAAPPHPDRA